MAQNSNLKPKNLADISFEFHFAGTELDTQQLVKFRFYKRRSRNACASGRLISTALDKFLMNSATAQH